MNINATLSDLRLSSNNWVIGIIDGPNMSTLGRRDASKYGTINRDELDQLNKNWGAALGITIESLVANLDGDILDWIHTKKRTVDAWIINPAGMQTYAEGIREAFEMSGKPYAETHFANTVNHFAKASPHTRLESGMTSQALSLTMGLRQYSYLASLVGLVRCLDARFNDDHQNR
ncbi:type II 3-dehydroquinate dehydratase [Zobellella aerophila]|uniref:3-dehydroquinate dehydratase n=1 Tax=Zobellella aerophila TaxID=870480 RepID=A0ABP6VIA5_9GAMM